MAVTKTRKLADLFRVGQDFSIDDGEGGVSVYLAKMNPVQSETAIRKANATRAKFLSSVKDKDGEDYLSIANEVLDLSKEDLVLYAAADASSKKVDVWEAEFLNESEWSKDDYLQGLLDSWNGDAEDPGLQSVYADGEEDSKDPEALRVFSEMERYEDSLREFVNKERSHIEEEMESFSVEKLQDIMIEAMVGVQSDMAWMIEYRKCEVWLGTYTITKPHTPYFATRSEVDALEGETLTRLIAGLGMLNVEVDEGKDSPLTEVSSLSSELQKTAETEDSSSPEE